MFISKKKYNEAIEKAKWEAEERIYQNQRFSNLEEQLNRRIDILERRIIELEGSANTPKEFKPFTDTHPNCRHVLFVKPRM